MGKTIDELQRQLDDTPLGTEDLRDTAWYQFTKDIDDLIATGRYGWALKTLEGIQQTVEETHAVTPAQRRAVTNIENQGEKKFVSGSRRYEGYR